MVPCTWNNTPGHIADLSVQMSKQSDMLNLIDITDSPLEQGRLNVKWQETLQKSRRNARLLHLLAKANMETLQTLRSYFVIIHIFLQVTLLWKSNSSNKTSICFFAFYEDIFANNARAALLPWLRPTAVCQCLQVNTGIGPYYKYGGFLSHLLRLNVNIKSHIHR